MERFREGLLLGIGNPLLDISAVVEEGLLLKYGMKPDDAIMAESKHKPLYEELMAEYNAEFIAGGSVQNTLRVAQWFFEKPYITSYFGCVGHDNYSKILKERASGDGVNVQYQYTDKMETGTCAVLITGTHRSLCANLAAANCFTEEHLLKPENNKLIEQSKCIYTSGFFLVVSPSSVMYLGQHALNNNKTFAMNLSAPFVSQFYKEPLDNILPYVDILFGNEMEMTAFAEAYKLGTNDMKEIGIKLCKFPKLNCKQSRIVIITQGCKPVLLIQDESIKEVPVKPLPEEEIVDTNGAGDAFTGGFLSQLILQEPLEVCVRCGIYAASEIIKQSGCTFENRPKFTR